MTNAQPDTELKTPIQWIVYQKYLVAEGQFDAWHDVRQYEQDPIRVRARIEEIEGYLNDSFLLSGPMKPGASPRIYREAYLAALHEALAVITAASIEYAINDEPSSERMLAETPDTRYDVSADSSTSEG